MSEIDLLGVSEVSELLGWDRRKLSTYIKRGKFPTPIHRVEATPLWKRSQIEEYMLKQKKPND
jgi:predicted DNA-binding transcriptional regulator AlpA